MYENEKKFFDIDYLIERDKIIKYLLDYDLYYSLSDSKKIRLLLKKLLKLLEKGKD